MGINIKISLKTHNIMDANTLEATLKNQQWVGGQSPSAADKDAFEALKSASPSAETHPNVFAWFCLVWKFSEAVRSSWPAAGGAAKGGDKGGKKGAKGRKPRMTIWMTSSVATMKMMVPPPQQQLLPRL